MKRRNLAQRNRSAKRGLTDAQRRRISERVFELLREDVLISAERQGLDRVLHNQ